jgi:DNA-binding GntR family transcriptional regulator
VDDTFPVRAVLEGLAARQALERMKPAVIKALEKSMAGMERAAEKDDPRLYLNHHVDYHETYIRASGNDVLVDVLTRLRMHTIWHRYYFQYHGEDFAKSLAVHRKILGMMADASTDPDSIERVVKNHIVAGYRRFLEYIREND